MKKLTAVIILSSFLSSLIPIMVGAISFGWPPPFSCPPGKICIPNPLKAKSFEELILNIVSFLVRIAIPIMTLMIIIGGFYFVTAGGDPQKISQGKQLIKWALIGFIIILLAEGIIAAVKEILGITK